MVANAYKLLIAVLMVVGSWFPHQQLAGSYPNPGGGGTSGGGAGAATTTINGTQSASFSIIGDGTTVTSSVSGATTTFSVMPTIASTSVTFIFDNATTTAPYSLADIGTPNQKNIAKIDCYEYAAATTTMEVYYNTTNASTGIQQVILPSITCGIGGNSTTTFTTATLPANAYLFAIVSSIAGTPKQTTLNVYATKQ